MTASRIARASKVAPGPRCWVEGGARRHLTIYQIAISAGFIKRDTPADHVGEIAVKQKLQDDLKLAMKAGDKLRVMTLRGALTEITRLEKDVQRPVNDDETIQILKRERARREETIGFARKGERHDLVAQNETVAQILDGYLPAALSSDEVKAAIGVQIAAGATQIGQIMKVLREQYGAQLDGRVASELVKQALASK